MSIRQIYNYRVTCSYSAGEDCYGQRDVSGTSIWDATTDLREDGWVIWQAGMASHVACPSCALSELDDKARIFADDAMIITSNNAPG